MRFLWVLVLVGCGDSAAAVDAAIDSPIGNPPLECPTSGSFTYTEPLPSLVATWTVAGFSAPSGTTTLTFATTGEMSVLSGVTANATAQQMHLFDGDWTHEMTVAYHCVRNGNATTISSVYMESGGPKISGETRVPGFHTAYETTEFYSGRLW